MLILGTTTIISEYREMRREEKREARFRNLNQKIREKIGDKNVKNKRQCDVDSTSEDDEGYLSFFSFQDFCDKLQSQDRKQEMRRKEMLRQSQEKKLRELQVSKALLDIPIKQVYKSVDNLNTGSPFHSQMSHLDRQIQQNCRRDSMP